jgi:nicotinamidase-related amidase
MTNRLILIVDMLSPYDFEGAGSLSEGAERVVESIARVRERAATESVPVVYANDMDDRFSGSRDAVVGEALAGSRPDLIEPLIPVKTDRFVHKRKHSAFYGTPLADLLHELGTEEVVLTGQVTEQCVLYTALDAHVRDYGITVLRDCVLSIDLELGAAALRMMEENMGARLSASTSFGD